MCSRQQERVPCSHATDAQRPAAQSSSGGVRRVRTIKTLNKKYSQTHHHHGLRQWDRQPVLPGAGGGPDVSDSPIPSPHQTSSGEETEGQDQQVCGRAEGEQINKYSDLNNKQLLSRQDLMVAALHKDGESITKLEKADVLGRNKGVMSQQ